MTKPFVIPKALVWEAFQRVKANGGSAGVDDESIAEFEERLGDNLYKLWNRMGSGSYFPPPVKAVPIPKKSGGTRTLGVPTVADRVGEIAARRGINRMQVALAWILSRPGVTAPIVVEPSVNATVPVGVPLLGKSARTATVKETAWPNTDGSGKAVMTVRLEA